MTKLEARIEARNRGNKAATELYIALLPVMAPYVGKKIKNADGSLVAKLKNEVDNVLAPFRAKNQVYQGSFSYSLSFVVKVCIQSDGCAYYDEVSVYLGELSGAILSKVCEPYQRKTDYKAEDVIKAREEVSRARKVMQAAEIGLQGFGEYDN